MKFIDKNTLLQLASNYCGTEIPREVFVYWLCIYGQDIDIPCDGMTIEESTPPELDNIEEGEGQ